MTEASQQHRNQLRTYLHGVDLDQLGIVQFDWGYIHNPLTTTATYLSDNVPVAKSVGGQELSSALATNFTHTAGHLHDRASKINKAASTLDAVNTALSNALKDQAAWDANPLTAPTAPDKTDPKYDQTDADGKPVNDYNADQATYNTQNSTYQSTSGDREQQAQQHMQNIDTAMTTAITAMKDIHQQPDSPSTPTDGSGAGGGGGVAMPAGAPVGTVPTSTRHPGVTTPVGVTGTTGGPDPVGTTHHHPAGPTGPTHVTDPPQGPGHTVPVWGGPGGSDGGSTWNGTDPSAGQPSSAGFPGGIGLGAAVLGGGLVAGAGGIAGIRALGGSLAEEGVLGLSGRGAGAPAVLGKGLSAAAVEEGAAGGRVGAGGGGGVGAGSRGGGAGAGAGGRGRGKGKKRPDGEHGDMWDDGEDWIDDEGVAPGVLD